MLKSKLLEENDETPAVALPEISTKSSLDDSGSGKGSILFIVSENREVEHEQLSNLLLVVFKWFWHFKLS